MMTEIYVHINLVSLCMLYLFYTEFVFLTFQTPKYSLVVIIFNSGVYDRARQSWPSWLLHFRPNLMMYQPTSSACCSDSLQHATRNQKISILVLCHSLVIAALYRSHVVVVTYLWPPL